MAPVKATFSTSRLLNRQPRADGRGFLQSLIESLENLVTQLNVEILFDHALFTDRLDQYSVRIRAFSDSSAGQEAAVRMELLLIKRYRCRLGTAGGC